MTHHPHASDDPPGALKALATAEPADLRKLLLEICASPQWAAAVAATRPWPDRAALLAANAAALATLSTADLTQALAGHARIGRPTPGNAASEREQAGIRGADRAVLDELDRANAAYEAKFGHVFLICATDRTAEAVLAALRERHPNTAATEAEIVRRELRRINDIRLSRLLDEAL
ncbi:2-oxo-4-hydroxy-4-carboxy-5-ureidoimidazoline decarboxylase [Kitasatospora sp. RB6PN24]|uniref:2-oxo-4-hydroxy-4-carboxy-5-ureidoimidazoline decarboxylase n=1 Tax=Kitasatospora humi TaxID=2893891 RepID=UPI001E4B0F8A|nr:2-oxo-4-hydroxy-4-carboxy-5-ureidoimidazoline decarboxylase [Kitasatospora humi]MCC9305548.1 2-oxo-4-hydroxy-4-carboxy-5-ureidoimidazoline decarboxylase [Kitasatospora humi]